MNTEYTSGRETELFLDNEYVYDYLTNVTYAPDECDPASPAYYTREEISKYSEKNAGERKDICHPYVITIPDAGMDSYAIIVAENPQYESCVTLCGAVGDNSIGWLKVNETYYIKVEGIRGETATVIAENVVKTKGLRRMIDCGGVSNMRDLGEIPTQDGGKLCQGKIFRCAVLSQATDAGKDLILHILGIKLIVGLARHNVRDDLTFPFPEVEKYHPCNFEQWDFITDADTRRLYIRALRKISTYLAANQSVLIHCNGGADRTGLFSAILEGICGVSENDVCKDYELTSFSISAEGKQRSRTRLGEKNADYEGGYRLIGFGSGMQYIKSFAGETLADKWKNYLKDTSLNTDTFTAMTDDEINFIVQALTEEA